jgi:YD repeat-containing protein
VAVTDERGNKTTYAYRSYGDPDQTYLMSIAAPDTSANVTITRNALDQILTATQGGVVRSYAYNANYYLTSVTDPETGVTSYGRDAAGNMTTRAVGASGTTSYTYDLQNRLTGASFPGNTSVAQTYTKTNKLSTVASGSSLRTFNYDQNENLTSDSLSIDTYSLSASYGYNANDQLSLITYPQSSQQISLSPDILGRPTAVSGYVSNVLYWPSGQVKQISYQNGAVSNYGQTSRLWPASFSTQNSAAAYYVNNSYVYDAVGDLTSIADTSTPDFNRTFGYDAINRLTTINASSSWGTGIIAYDGKGNITSQTFGTAGVNYAYSAQNQLSSVSGALRNASYTYDSYGDILSDGAGKTYTFNGVPNLVGVSDTNSGTSITYAYDGLNKRTKISKNGIITYEFYDFSGKLLVELTPGVPNKLVEYIYLGNMRIAQHLSAK